MEEEIVVNEEVKVEEPVAEVKAEEPKAEEPKVEEAKAEEPKVEEAKAEEPEAEEPVKVADENQTMESLGEELEKSLKAGPPKNDDPVWDKFEQLLKDKETFEVKIDSVVKGGVIAFVDEVRGFIPASQLAASFVEKLEEFKGKTIPVNVIKVERETKKLVLSGKAAAKAKLREARKAAIETINKDEVYEGVVESLKEYGAFVTLKEGVSGLLHVSQISYKRVKVPADVLNVGDKVTVKVIDKKDGKISLSIKALEEKPERQPRENSRRREDDGPRSYSDKGEVSTTMGDLFSKIKL